MPRYFLGVDGGQSSTTALIGNQAGDILGRGVGGPCNHVTATEAEEKFRDAMNTSIGEACRHAQLDASAIVFTAACFGFSGGVEDKDFFTRALIRSNKYKTTHDAEIALIGAHAGEPGIIAIAGTGSMAFGRNAQLQTARAGGWGYLFGDEGGAFDMVRRALRKALAAEEGWGEKTVLTDLLLTVTGFVTVNQVLHAFYGPGWDRARIAQLAPKIIEAAGSGDELAGQVVEESASELAKYVQGVHTNIFPSEQAPVAIVGGVFKSDLFRTVFARQVLQRVRCQVVTPQLGPAEGALVEAIRIGV